MNNNQVGDGDGDGDNNDKIDKALEYQFPNRYPPK